MDTIDATIAGMLNDIENEGPFGFFVDDDVPGQYHFRNVVLGVDYIFDLNEVIDIWKELNV